MNLAVKSICFKLVLHCLCSHMHDLVPCACLFRNATLNSHIVLLLFHADVDAQQLLGIIVLMTSAAAMLGSGYCRNWLGYSSSSAAGPVPAAELRSGITRLASCVGRTASAVVKMVVEDAVGPAGLQPHTLSVSRQASAAVPFLLLLLKQLSVSCDISRQALAYLVISSSKHSTTQFQHASTYMTGAISSGVL